MLDKGLYQPGESRDIARNAFSSYGRPLVETTGRSKISAIKLAAFDVDGTILRGENICRCIAKNIGRSTEMDAFELLRASEKGLPEAFRSQDRSRLDHLGVCGWLARL